MIGKGQYDDILTEARLKAGALGAILIVCDGSKGDGFSAQLSLPAIMQMPRILREVADAIEADFKKGIL